MATSSDPNACSSFYINQLKELGIILEDKISTLYGLEFLHEIYIQNKSLTSPSVPKNIYNVVKPRLSHWINNGNALKHLEIELLVHGYTRNIEKSNDLPYDIPSVVKRVIEQFYSNTKYIGTKAFYFNPYFDYIRNIGEPISIRIFV